MAVKLFDELDCISEGDDRPLIAQRGIVSRP